jgi:hypothetical protein
VNPQALPFDAPPMRYERQKQYREKARAEGLCVACFELYTCENPKTGKPFWQCQRCRYRSSAHYLQTGKQL